MSSGPLNPILCLCSATRGSREDKAGNPLASNGRDNPFRQPSALLDLPSCPWSGSCRVRTRSWSIRSNPISLTLVGVTVRALPGFAVAVLAAGLAGAPTARAEPSCAGADPWVLVALRADGWTAAQRDGVIADLRRTLAGQGIGTCLADAHPASEPLATLAIELPSASRASVDIEVRDAVTHKRVRRDVDLAPIPPTVASWRSRSRRTATCARAGRRSRSTRSGRGRPTCAPRWRGA